MVTWFGNLRTMWKVMLGFALVGIVMAFAAVAIYARITSLIETLRIVYEDYTVAGTDLAHVANNLMRYRTNLMLAMAAPDRTEFERLYERSTSLKDKIYRPLDAYAATVLRVSRSGRDETHDLHAFRQVLDDYLAAAQQSLSLERQAWTASAKDDAAALHEKAKTLLVKQADPKLADSLTALDELLTTVADVAKDMNEDGKTAGTNAIRALFGSIILAVALGLVVGYLVARFIATNLATVLAAAQALGGGNLAARATVAAQDEVGRLAQAFNDMGAQLEAKVTAGRPQARAADRPPPRNPTPGSPRVAGRDRAPPRTRSRRRPASSAIIGPTTTTSRSSEVRKASGCSLFGAGSSQSIQPVKKPASLSDIHGTGRGLSERPLPSSTRMGTRWSTASRPRNSSAFES